MDTRTEMLQRLVSSTDPYTGSALPAQRRQRHIDHLFPLSAAWDMGASRWTQDKRIAFANDTARNLIVVGAAVNEEKGDSTPAQWMPPWKGSWCWYSYRYLQAALYYDLAVSQADYQVLRRASKLCPRHPVSISVLRPEESRVSSPHR